MICSAEKAGNFDCRPFLLVLHQGNNLGCRASQTDQGKAQPAENGRPFSRAATPHWPVWGAPVGPAGKRPSALLHSLELAMASPSLARLAASRFPTGCILIYYPDGVLGPVNTNQRISDQREMNKKHKHDIQFFKA